VQLPDNCEQKEVMQSLLDRGVASRRGIMCAHREPAYKDQDWRAAGALVHSEYAQDRGLMIPLYPQIDETEKRELMSSLREVLAAEYVLGL